MPKYDFSTISTQKMAFPSMGTRKRFVIMVLDNSMFSTSKQKLRSADSKAIC